MVGMLRGNLQAVEKPARELAVDAAVEHGVEDPREGDLDGGGVLQDREGEGTEPGGIVADPGVELGVEVAEAVAAHGRGLAAEAVGFDVPTCHVHLRTPSPHTPSRG